MIAIYYNFSQRLKNCWCTSGKMLLTCLQLGKQLQWIIKSLLTKHIKCKQILYMLLAFCFFLLRFDHHVLIIKQRTICRTLYITLGCRETLWVLSVYPMNTENRTRPAAHSSKAPQTLWLILLPQLMVIPELQKFFPDDAGFSTLLLKASRSKYMQLCINRTHFFEFIYG